MPHRKKAAGLAAKHRPDGQRWSVSRGKKGRGHAQASCFAVNTGHHDRVHSPNCSAHMELWYRFAIVGYETVKETTKCLPPF